MNTLDYNQALYDVVKHLTGVRDDFLQIIDQLEKELRRPHTEYSLGFANRKRELYMYKEKTLLLTGQIQHIQGMNK